MIERLTYNGYTFGEYSHVKVASEMVYDDAQRTVPFHKYVIDVDTTIVAESEDSNVGAHFLRIRQRLSKPGEALIFDHNGFGPLLAVNVASHGGVRDVNWGPKPRVITWSPVGNTNAVEVTWQCECCIPICDGSQNQRFDGLSAMNYEVSYQIDKMGYTTRTISGFLEIAMTRTGHGEVPDTADSYRDTIQPYKLVNADREYSWRLSTDKRRADFTITDKEIATPNVYHPGVVSISANHRIGLRMSTMNQLQNNISASITLAANQPRGRAWEIFRSIVTSRISYIGPNTLFWRALEIDEELYGYTINFSIMYEIYGKGPRDILGFTGVFQEVPSDSTLGWKSRQDSLDEIQRHRGIAQLANNKTEDVLIDLCTNDIPQHTQQPYKVTKRPPTPLVRFCNPKPHPYDSWLHFDGSVLIREHYGTVQQISVGPNDLVDGTLDPSNPIGSVGKTDVGAQVQRIIESASGPIEIEWSGSATRVGYDIPRPQLTHFGNVPLVPVSNTFAKKLLGKFFCQEMYQAIWTQKYTVGARPEVIPAKEADPVYGEGYGFGE